jgi:hypothetical protein
MIFKIELQFHLIKLHVKYEAYLFFFHLEALLYNSSYKMW